MSDIKFDGKVAVITGAGAGLGRTYALELAKRGAKIVVNDLGGSRDGSGAGTAAADTVVNEIKEAGGTAVANYDSVATIEGGEGIIKTAIDSFGRVDILVNNAGILRDRSLAKMTEDEWDIIQDVNLKGSFCVTRAAWPYMKENNFGRIVLTSSGAGLYGNFGQANYASAKMGILGFMNVIKIEGAKYNIMANTIAPIAASRLSEDVLPPELYQKLKPEFVTPMVVFLCSEENRDSGMVFNCAMGWYSRTVVMCCDGAIIGDGSSPVTVEDIGKNWGKITDMNNPRFLENVIESFGYLKDLMS